MKKFSQQTSKMNAKNMKNKIHTSPGKREISKRDRALEFAMRIKKPKHKASNLPLAIEFENTKERNKLWDIEVDDQKLRLQKEKIKMIYK